MAGHAADDIIPVFAGHAAGVVHAAFDADERRVLSCDWKGGDWIGNRDGS